MERTIFEKICSKYKLGNLIESPRQLTGGFMHKMFSIFTDTGKYAVKLLNPYVMKRDDVMKNYNIAENLESILEQNNIPILPALSLDNAKMQRIDEQYFYLFEWYDGAALKSEEITEYHCDKIGEVLAGIHKIDKKSAPYNRSEIHIDWDFYIEKMKTENDELYILLKDNRSLLCESQEKGNSSIKKLPQIISICHNDMDSKNVLWNGDDFRIIDLECLNYSNPYLELYELALCWSGYEHCNIDFCKFNALINAYLKFGGTLPDDWETIYYSNYGRLEWLGYNVKRVLGIDSGEDEKEIGISEVKETIAHIIYYDKIKYELLSNLYNRG